MVKYIIASKDDIELLMESRIEMIRMLIEEAKRKDVTEISLDATELGKPLYEKFGFVESKDSMSFKIK